MYSTSLVKVVSWSLAFSDHLSATLEPGDKAAMQYINLDKFDLFCLFNLFGVKQLLQLVNVIAAAHIEDSVATCSWNVEAPL